MDKFKMLPFCQKVFLLHRISSCKVQCVFIMYAKTRNVSVKPLVINDFSVHSLSMHHSELQRAITIIELVPST